MRFNIRKENTSSNFAGGTSYMLSPTYALYSAAVTSLLHDTYYETGSERLARLQDLIAQNDPMFVAKLAVYAREKMYLRTMPIVLVVELCKHQSGNSLVRKTLRRIIQRPDEITETLAYYTSARKEPKKLNKLAHQIQKGLADAFNKFDEYQFAKYNRKGTIQLRDALFIVHPRPKDEAQQAIFNRLAHKSLKTPETWEVALTQAGEDTGNVQLNKRQAWEKLIDENKMGYMAILRNLRNFIEIGINLERLQKIANYLASPTAIQNSKQFPFRFLAAYREIYERTEEGVSLLLNALENAIQASIVNIPGFAPEESVVIACDVSGSMQLPISPKSKVLYFDIGLVLAMLLKTKCTKVLTGIFGDEWKAIDFPRAQGVLQNVTNMYTREGEVGYSTNGYKVIAYLNAKKYQADKVLIFTDTQMWNSANTNDTFAKEWKKYKKQFPSAKLYLFDLAGYGNTPLEIVPKESIFLIAGWSDKIFEVLSALERGADGLAEVEKITIE